MPELKRGGAGGQTQEMFATCFVVFLESVPRSQYHATKTEVKDYCRRKQPPAVRNVQAGRPIRSIDAPKSWKNDLQHGFFSLTPCGASAKNLRHGTAPITIS